MAANPPPGVAGSLEEGRTHSHQGLRHDSRNSQGPRQRSQVRGRSGVRLTERDVEVLRWVGEVNGVETGGPGVGLLDWLLGRDRGRAVSRRTRRDWLERMRGQGLVQVASVAGAEFVSLSLHGARMLEVPYQKYGLTPWGAKHVAAVGEVRFWLETRTLEPEGEWVPESFFRVEPGHSQEGARRPDGAWASVSGNLIGIEVELTRKGKWAGYYRDLQERADHRLDSVWWFVPTGADRDWLAPRVKGATTPAAVALLPFLDRPLLHPWGCKCLPCRARAEREPGRPFHHDGPWEPGEPGEEMGA